MTSQGLVLLSVTAAVALAAYQTQTAWLYVMAACGLGLLGVSWWAAWRVLRPLRLSASAFATVPVGGLASGRVRLKRQGRDSIFSSLGLGGLLAGWGAGAGEGVLLCAPAKTRWQNRVWRTERGPASWQPQAFEALAPGEERTLTVTLSTERRGEFAWPRLWLQSAFPFGLIALRRSRPVEGTYLVYPVGPALTEVPWLGGGPGAAEAAAAFDAGAGALLRGMREWRSGDALRDIHWRTTARRGAPHVKETEVESEEPRALFVDLRADVHTPETLEHALCLAAALLDYARAQGLALTLATQREAVPQGATRPGEEAQAWLARAQASAPAGPLEGPAGAIVISPAYEPGWQRWAAHYVYCPAQASNAWDTSAYCPVGADLAACLSTERVG